MTLTADRSGEVAAAVAGDEAAFAALTERHRRALHLHCYRLLASFDEAEDAVQEAFLHAWRSRESFDGGSLFRAFKLDVLRIKVRRSLWRAPSPAELPLTTKEITMSVTNGDNATTGATGRYAPVHGLNLYYEEHGAGDPLIVLHGGVGGPEMFGLNLPLLAASRRVIAVHLQGHGRTADVDRPLRYELMADDIAALLAHLGIPTSDLLGYSLGAGVALQTAIRHPAMVRRLVVVSRPCKREGWYPEVQASFEQMGPQTGRFMSQSPLSQLYPTVDWPALFAKIGDLERQEYDWSAQVAQLTLPVMLVFADADAVRLSHIMEFYGLLGGGQRDAGLDGSGRSANRLAIVPGCTHYDILSTPAIAQMALPFLDGSFDETENKVG